jgi:hypothetical protein
MPGGFAHFVNVRRHKFEIAKHRPLHTLLRLGLRLATRFEDPFGLAFAPLRSTGYRSWDSGRPKRARRQPPDFTQPEIAMLWRSYVVACFSPVAVKPIASSRNAAEKPLSHSGILEPVR